MNGNIYHHPEENKFLVDRCKRKSYAGNRFLTARTLSKISSSLKIKMRIKKCTNFWGIMPVV
jgi:hypothetical protein